MKSLLPSREQTPIIITLIVVILLGASYYFIYLPGNEKNIQKWKFRTLKNVDTNVRAKIRNGNLLLGTYLKSDSLAKYKARNNPELSSGLSKYIHNLNSRIRALNSKKFPIDTIIELRKIASDEPETCINAKKQLVIRRVEAIHDSSQLQVSLTYNFNDFIEPLLPQDVFDEYMVIGSKSVLYESDKLHSGLDYSDDSLLKFQSAMTSSIIKDRTFGGVNYKLFIQPVMCDGNTKIFVIGLLSGEHYQQGKTKLPPRVILFLITLFTGILVSLPIIKLYQLGQEDRLTIMDAMSSTIVSMLLMALVFFVFLKYNNLLPRNITKDPKEVLADTISKAFLDEIKINREKVVNLDLLMASNQKYQRDIFSVGQKDFSDRNGLDLDSVNLLSEKIDLDRTFWLNSSGLEVFAWKASKDTVAFHGEFKERTYFKKVINQQAWESDTSIYYLEPVISWIDGAFITLISVPSKVKNIKVAVLSFFVKSLDKVKMPLGYSFAVIDKSGKVLYHSNATKNLQENLIDEFSASDNLTTYLRTGAPERFTTNYFAKEYSVQVKAIDEELPYYLVILDDLSFEESRDIDVYSFTFSMQFLLFALLIIQMLIVFFASAKRSAYQDQLFDTGWLGPKKSSHKEYVIAAGYNIYIFVALCVFPFGSVICRLFMLLFAVSILPVFLNLLYIKKYANAESVRRYKVRAMRLAGSISGLIVVIALVVLDQSWWRFLLFDLICLIPVILVIYFKKIQSYLQGKLTPGKKSRLRTIVVFLRGISSYSFILDKTTFGNSFTALIFTWLIVTCGLPVIIFFTAAYNYDQHLIARTKQFDLANNLINDLNAKEEKKSQPVRKGKVVMDSLAQSFYRDAYWADSAGITQDSKESDAAEDEVTINILNSFRIYQSPNVNERKDLLKSRAFHFPYFFNSLIKQVSSQSDSTVTHLRLNDKSRYLSIRSAALNFSFPPIYKLGGILCWLALFLALFGMFKLLHSIIKKLFALNLPDTSDWRTLDKEIMLNNAVGDSIFVIGLPYSGKREWIEKNFKTDGNKQSDLENKGSEIDKKELVTYKKAEVDFRRISAKKDTEDISAEWNKLLTEVVEGKYNLVIVDHFGHNINDHITNNVKLQFLENLLIKARKCKVIILSEIHPVTLLEALKESAATETDQRNIERWQVLLGNYKIIVHRLSEFNKEENINPVSEVWEEIDNVKFLYEINASVKKQPGFSSGRTLDKEKEESLAFKLQTTSYQYYFAVWQSLTKEEKFLLYDLAEDGLVNPFDKTTLCLLLDKGVILKHEGRLKLFNHGFRHFILTGIGGTETAKIMEKVNDNRNWNKIKIPLAVISITILGFLLSSQHETSTKLITTLTALAGVIPVVINFLSSLGSGNQQKK